jgi:arylsulfatase A-like enzyme
VISLRDSLATPIPVRWSPVRAAWLAVLLLACGGSAPGPNFLLVSIDTLRADHLGCYGYARVTSPRLDRFAKRSVRFESAFAPAPWTLPSHVAMLSGRHPYDVGIVGGRSSIPSRVDLLSEALAASDYQTAAFVDSLPGGLLGVERGFARGFQTYRHAPHTDASPYDYDMASTVDAALGWLERRDRSRPFFLFLHTKSVHATPESSGLSDAPYDKPQPYLARFLPEARPRFAWRDEQQRAGVRYLRDVNQRIAAGSFGAESFPAEKIEELVALYDAGIYYTDEHFGRLLDRLAVLGLDRDTVVVVTADHGEAFLEHRFLLHKPRLAQGRTEHRPVTLMDIAPTLLARAGLPTPSGLSGRPLPLRGGAAEPPPPLFGYYNFEDDPDYEAFALQEGPWKLVHHRFASDARFRTELYDTRADPAELRPLVGEAERRRAMLGRLAQRMHARGSERASRIELDAETVERLRELGYLE